MNLLQKLGPSLTDTEGKSLDELEPLESNVYMSGGDETSSKSGRRQGLAAFEDARALVRLVQCWTCSRPLRLPVTLPCGHSLCRDCLPQPHLRVHISWPNVPGRQEGILCPIEGCELEHSLADCSVDVTLSKVMESIQHQVAQHRPATENGTPTLLEEVMAATDVAVDCGMDSGESGEMSSEKEKLTLRSRILHGGRLLSTFTFAEMGELNYKAELSYQTLSPDGDDYKRMDEDLLKELRETTHKELDCQVCYNLMLDPITTSCGHTFCRKCLARVLDHSSHCPICRRTLPVAPSLTQQPSNARLVSLLDALCPEQITSRAEAVAQEELGTVGELDVPLFPCTLGFPSMPTFLHIFEPRYRLMFRRALEGNRQFGMMMYNRHAATQGELGVTQFMQYGTMLQIVNVQMLPDGRSLIEARGVDRFRIRAFGQHDGYIIGNVERVEDVSLAEEERIEADETSQPPPAENDILGQIERLSTSDLMHMAMEFVIRMRANSAPWLHQNIIDAYGGPPDDPALFPYWFASILPVAEEEKYQLLQTTSVRERLKVTARWIKRIEAQRCDCVSAGGDLTKTAIPALRFQYSTPLPVFFANVIPRIPPIHAPSGRERYVCTQISNQPMESWFAFLGIGVQPCSSDTYTLHDIAFVP